MAACARLSGLLRHPPSSRWGVGRPTHALQSAHTETAPGLIRPLQASQTAMRKPLYGLICKQELLYKTEEFAGFDTKDDREAFNCLCRGWQQLLQQADRYQAWH